MDLNTKYRIKKIFRKPKWGKSLGCRAGKVFLDFIPKALSMK